MSNKEKTRTVKEERDRILDLVEKEFKAGNIGPICRMRLVYGIKEMLEDERRKGT
jgi:hypothetical protein